MAKENNVLQIGSINLPAFTNDAHFIYMKDVEETMEGTEAVKAIPNVKTAVAVLKVAVAEEDKYLMLSKKSPFTAQLAAKDKERDSLLRGYRSTVKGFLRMPTASMAHAATELWQHLKDYNIDPDMQLERETSRIMNLVDDLHMKYSAQVTLLGLSAYVDALEQANEAVNDLLLNRTEEQSKQVVGALRKARKVSDEAYLNAVRLINAVVVVGTDKDFVPLIKFLNENIKRYKEQVMTHSKKNDDDIVGNADREEYPSDKRVDEPTGE